MLINQKTGNRYSSYHRKKDVEWIELDWHESNKRILHKKTDAGTLVSMKFLKENPELSEGDIVYEDAEKIIAISILACDAIVVRPKTMHEMALICYEIGNKHLPLFYSNNELMVAYETGLFNLLISSGYYVVKEKRKLIHPLKTSVTEHTHGESLFSKIMKMTTT